MDYSSISSFLEKFKNTLFKKETIYKDIISTISKEVGVVLNIDDIKILGTEIKIKGSPVVKNEILIRKNKILELLKNIQPNSIFTDIN